MFAIANGRKALWQWDLNQQLTVAGSCTEVHYLDKGAPFTLTVAVKDGKADIPNVLLQRPGRLVVYAYIVDAQDHHTKTCETFGISARPKPDDYVYTETEVKTWNDLQSQIGDLADLETEAKDNLVAAVNELAECQADYGQNDSTAKDYIKNRTHWCEHNTIIEETAFTIESGNDTCELGEFEATLNLDDMLDVVYDGVAYTVPVNKVPGLAWVESDNFYIEFEPRGDKFKITINGSDGNHTISILQRVYHPIPDEYIPDWVANKDDVVQPDWAQNDGTASDYIKNRPGGYYGEIKTYKLGITATKQDGSNKLTDVYVYEDNFTYEDSIHVEIDCSSGTINRVLTKREIPEGFINSSGATIYGNAHLIHESQPDTGEDLAMYRESSDDSMYDIGWHIWATSVPSGMLELYVATKRIDWIPFESYLIPWKESPTADSVLYTAQSLTEEKQAQARANIGAGTPYTLPQATAEAIGGVKADSAEAADTQPVRIGRDGKLYTTPGITDISTKMDANNPVGTGSFSMNRKVGTPIGVYSYTEGMDTTASSNCSHAEGFSTIASMDYSHAEGNRTIARGDSSHAEGYQTTASGQSSHAEGYSTTASGDFSHAQGKFNIEDTSSTYADIIGNGTSNTARSNAATVDWSGNAWFAGDVYTGSTSGTNKDDGSKKLATEEYVNNSIAAGGTDLSLGLTSASVGQIIKVKAVDESGKPTEWEAADMAGGGVDKNLRWAQVLEMTTTEQMNIITADKDPEGRTFASYNAIAMLTVLSIPADSTQTSANGTVWVTAQPTGYNSRASLNIVNWKTKSRTISQCHLGTVGGLVWCGSSNSGSMITANLIDNIFTIVKIEVHNTDDHLPIGTTVRVFLLSEENA